jgi:hypothetical protein
VRIVFHTLFRAGDTDLRHHLDGFLECGFFIQILVLNNNFDDLVADLHNRIERSKGFLEYHCDLVTTVVLHIAI